MVNARALRAAPGPAACGGPPAAGRAPPPQGHLPRQVGTPHACGIGWESQLLGTSASRFGLARREELTTTAGCTRVGRPLPRHGQCRAKGRQDGTRGAPPGTLCQRSPGAHLPPACWASWCFISHSAAAAVGLPGMDELGEAGWGGSAGWENLERPLRGSGCRARPGTRRWRSRGEKKTLPFIAKPGLLGACGRVGATTAGPGSPSAPPPPPAKLPGAHKPPRPGTELLSGHGGLPWPGTHGRSAGMENSWKRGCPRPQLSGGFRLGVYSSAGAGEGSGMPSVMGSTPRAAEGLVVMTDSGMSGHREGSGVEPDCEQGRGKEGWWEQAGGTRAGAGGTARWPRCSEHPLELVQPPRSLGEPGPRLWEQCHGLGLRGPLGLGCL